MLACSAQHKVEGSDLVKTCTEKIQARARGVIVLHSRLPPLASRRDRVMLLSPPHMFRAFLKLVLRQSLHELRRLCPLTSIECVGWGRRLRQPSDPGRISSSDTLLRLACIFGFPRPSCELKPDLEMEVLHPPQANRKPRLAQGEWFMM